MRFLIDENLSPLLCPVAHARDHEAYHVAHLGWSGIKDPLLYEKVLDDNYTLVTNNRDHFLALVLGTHLHPGLVVIVEPIVATGRSLHSR